MKNKQREKTSKKKNQRIKTLVLAAGLLICCCLVLVLLITITNKQIYKVDSRVSAVEKEKKKDKKDATYETIAWLTVQGTNIDAPIVSFQKPNGLDYVEKDDYLWNNNPNEKFYNQVAISGHNLLNLSSNPEIGLDYFSRFDDLMAFVYEDFAKENKYIQYTVDGEDYVYKIFGVFFEKSYNIDLTTNKNYSEQELKSYIDKVKESSFYDYDIKVDETDSVITLTTCTRMFGQGDGRNLVVVGRLLRDNEKMNNYDVKANEKYKEIKNAMKGDEQDEKTQEV